MGLDGLKCEKLLSVQARIPA